MNSNMDTPAPQVKPKGKSGGDREPVQVGQILTRQQVIYREKISPNTLKQWEKMGLQMYAPPGKVVTTGEDILEFVKRFPVVRETASKPAGKPKKGKGK